MLPIACMLASAYGVVGLHELSKTFYKFINLMFLDKIEAPYFIEFFYSRFTDTGKSIIEETSWLIIELVNNLLAMCNSCGSE